MREVGVGKGGRKGGEEQWSLGIGCTKLSLRAVSQWECKNG